MRKGEKNVKKMKEKCEKIWSVKKKTLPLHHEIVKVFTGCSAVRLAHLLWEQGVPGSNPGIPTI